MKKYNFTEMTNRNDSKKGNETRISFWFNDKERKEACLTYGIYKTLTKVDVYSSLMKIEHSLTFKIDDTKEYYINKLECGLNKEIRRQEKNCRYDKEVLKYFKNNPNISEVFEKVSEELDDAESKESKVKKIFITDITKENPLFNSKELLKLCAEDKYYATISLEDFSSKNLRVWYNLRGLGGVGVGIPVNLYPTETLMERIVKAVSKFEKDNDVDIIPRFFNSFTSKKFDRNIAILTSLMNCMKDNTISSIEVNPMVYEYMTAPIDPNVFHLDIKVTRKIENTEFTNGYLLMREHRVGERLMHHYPQERLYVFTLYRYNPSDKVEIDKSHLKLRPLNGGDVELTVSPTQRVSSLQSLSFGRICIELCNCLGKDLSLLMNSEYMIGRLMGLVYDNKVKIPYDSDTLDRLNETQLQELYSPFIEEVINAFSDKCNTDYFRDFGRFSKIDQIRATVAYNFRNLLAELDDRLANHITVSEADCMLITDCEVLKGPAEFNTIEVKLSRDFGKHLMQKTSLRDTLYFFMNLSTKSGKTVIRILEILLTKDGPVVSSIIADKKYRDTKKFYSVQYHLNILLGDYLYGLLTFLGKLLYIYDLLNDNVRNTQYLNITKDGETTKNVVELTYGPVEGTYIKYLKELRYNNEPEEEFVDEENEEEY